MDTIKKAITIVVDGTDYKTEEHILNGAQIKVLAHRPTGNRLFRIHGKQRDEIADNQEVHLHDGEQFVTLPPCGKAS